MIFTFNVNADELQLRFDKGNEYFGNGEYDKAISTYTEIIQNGYIAAELYYNLGNSYFTKDSIPAAILYYEKAKTLKPNDEDVDYNLKLANLRVLDKIEPLPQLFLMQWWSSLGRLQNSTGWSMILIISLWLAFGAGILFVAGKMLRVKRIGFLLSCVFGLCVLLAFNFSLRQYDEELNHPKAIVFSPIVYVKNSPDMNGTDLFIIHEGLKVEVVDKVGEWNKIKLVNGKVGWLASADIEII
ncbi:MAG: tetratricopeptide repeat protein [Bacteroidia bacterium]|nr:tetratricopeptide repeat protein [Bacteroidia bacterium]